MMTDRTIGKANGEFLGHLVEVVERRKSIEWLRTKWPQGASKQIAADNLKHWGIS